MACCGEIHKKHKEILGQKAHGCMYSTEIPKTKKKRRKGYVPSSLPESFVTYEPCVHLHFKDDQINRNHLTHEQYMDLLATPKGYRWTRDMNYDNPELNISKRKQKIKKKPKYVEPIVVKPDGGDFADEFVEDMWDVMSPDIRNRLIDFLVNEFDMSIEEAEDFIDCKIAAGKQTVCKKKKSADLINLGTKHKWVKDFSGVFAKRIEQYIASMLLTRRTPRVKRIAERILINLCDLSGVKTTLGNPKTKMQRIMVLISDRLALWIEDLMKDIDKPSKRIAITEEEEDIEKDEEEKEKDEEEKEKDEEEKEKDKEVEEEKEKKDRKKEEEERNEEKDQFPQEKKPTNDEPSGEKEEQTKEPAQEDINKAEEDKATEDDEKENTVETKQVNDEQKPDPEPTTEIEPVSSPSVEETPEQQEPVEDEPPKDEPPTEGEASKEAEPTNEDDTSKENETSKENDTAKVEEASKNEEDQHSKEAEEPEETDESKTEADKDKLSEEEKTDEPSETDNSPETEKTPETEKSSEEETIDVEEAKTEKVEKEQVEPKENEGETPEVEKQEEGMVGVVEEEKENVGKAEDEPTKKEQKEVAPEETEKKEQIIKEKDRRPIVDIYDLVKKDIEGIPKDKITDRQKAIKGVVDRRLEKIVAEKDYIDVLQKGDVDDAASRVAHWIEHVMKATDPAKGVVCTPQKSPGPALLIKQKTGSTLEVYKLSSGTVAQEAALAKGLQAPPQERKIPTSESPINLKSAQEWENWATNTAYVFDEWGKWLDSTLNDAERQTVEKRKEAPKTDWMQWQNEKQTEARKWRVEKEKIKAEGTIWNKKIDENLKHKSEAELKSTEF